MYKVKFIIIKPDSFRSEFGWLGIRYILAELKKVPDISVSIDLISDKEQDDILARLHKHPPDIIGMPAFQLNLNTIRSLTAKIKSILPHVHITLGNIEATIHQETLFNYLPHMDSLVVGEGEYSFRELVERLQNHRSLQGCEGLLYRKGTEIVRNKMRPLEQNIDTFAFPDRDILPPFTSGFQVFDVITSRGCNGNCTFCNNQNFRMQDVYKRQLIHLIMNFFLLPTGKLN